jgi:hypothetical protein
VCCLYDDEWTTYLGGQKGGQMAQNKTNTFQSSPFPDLLSPTSGSLHYPNIMLGPNYIISSHV